MDDLSGIKNEIKEIFALAKFYRYCILKSLGKIEEIDETYDAREKKCEEDSDLKYFSSIYKFKESFLKLKGKTPFNANILDYRDEAVEFLDNTYPYCFGLNLDNNFEMAKLDKEFRKMVELAFFAYSQGINGDKIPKLIEILKNTPKEHLTIDKNTRLSIAGDDRVQSVNINSIVGSTVERYDGENLYEIFLKIDDKGIGKYIRYIMENGGVENCSSIFNGINLIKDEKEKMFVSEGNHRIFIYQILSAVKSNITGKKIEGINFEATVQNVIRKDFYQEWQFE